MIRLKQHIDLMGYIQKGLSPEEYIDSIKPIEKLDFIRYSRDTYPIQDHTKHPASILYSKNVFYKKEVMRKTSCRTM